MIAEAIGIILLGVGLVCYGAVWWGRKRRIRQVQIHNREVIRDRALHICPIHGPQESDTMVLLQDGTELCGRCYADTLLGDSGHAE